MPRLALALLGPFEATLAGTPVAGFGYDKVEALLAYLAVEADRPHRREALAGLLWPEQEERAARHSLSQALSTLRRALGDRPAGAGGEGVAPLLLARDTVQFTLAGDDWLDVAAFIALLDDCARHPHRGPETCARCARRLERAVALYRGDFLAEFSLPDSAPFEEWALARREWLRGRALWALARLAAYHEARGAHDQAGEYARRQLALDPWREEAHRQLMRALALGGLRAAALAHYERCRRLLADELGCEPEAATTALCREIRGGGLAPSPAAIPRAAARPALPSQPGPLIGRERELSELAALLADPACRLVTLVGPGGIGKTRLGIAAAAGQADAFADGVSFVALAPLRAADQLVPALADALGLTLHVQHDPREDLLAALGGREALLVLDNFEHLLDGAPLVAAILARAPDVTILVTSRERLNLGAEWVFAVEGLAVPGEGEAGPPDDYDAVRLFVERARKARAHFALGAAERPAVARICRLVGGMPLALELAAAWAAALPCAEIAREIEAGLDVLATPRRDVPERHRTMRAVFDHSWNLLTARQREAFAALAVFRGGCERAAAEAVAGASLFTLAALVGKSFLRLSAAGRYEVHELLRQYGATQLGASAAGWRLAHDRHCDYYLEFLAAREERLRGHDQRAALAEIERDYANVWAAWQWAVEHGGADLIARAADGLWLFHATRGSAWLGEAAFGGAVAALERTAAAAGAPDPMREIALAKALTGQGSYHYRVGAYDRARELLGRSVALCRRLGLSRELGFALHHLAATLHPLGAYVEEARCLRVGIAHSLAADDRWTAAYSRNDLGMAIHLLGDDAEARRLATESLTDFEEFGDRRGAAFALTTLGAVAAAGGDLAEAARLHGDSLALRRAIGDQWGIADSLTRLGVVARAAGSMEEARGHLLAALRAAHDTRVPPMALAALAELGAVQAQTGEQERARDLLAVVLRHPASTRASRDQAERLLAGRPCPRPGPAATPARTLDDL
ncbi:MAG TPA: BTAD domain-containing putative transcriptional regulator, partial [Thermomicrobiales bacterium]|nr:BTAD domain-containing putative transcriptional regulator [Thermomicrobiales bacterium]